MAPTALSSPSGRVSAKMDDNQPALVETGGFTTMNNGVAGPRPKGRARLSLSRNLVTGRQMETGGQLGGSGRHANGRNDEPNDTYERNDERNTNAHGEFRHTTT